MENIDICLRKGDIVACTALGDFVVFMIQDKHKTFISLSGYCWWLLSPTP
jgi:hypothetical protein